jgi:hypothetical protein
MRALLALFCLALLPAPAQRALPSRAEMSAVEESLLNKLRRFNLEAPVEVLGLPRGVYLEDYGAVFSAELNLIQTPGISPFRPQLTKEDIARVRAAKEKRLPELRQQMRQMLLDSAASLDRVPQEQQVVLALSLFYNSWEDRGSMPQMITMQAPRSALVNVATNRVPRSSLDSVLRIREE